MIVETSEALIDFGISYPLVLVLKFFPCVI
jgi:hypothetical protein